MTEMIMRYKPVSFLLISLLLISAAVTGCELLYSENVCESTECEVFEVHLNNNFDDDYVRVQIDEKTVFNKRITTNYVWSLAEIIELQRPEGSHHINIIVNENEEAEQSFSLYGKLYIHVRYYPEPLPDLNIPKGIKIDFNTEPPMYD